MENEVPHKREMGVSFLSPVRMLRLSKNSSHVQSSYPQAPHVYSLILLL